jgi:pimeloyl-ACP methyl ester carboxylesterase
VRTGDGRTLAAYEAGDPSGELVLVHHGTPGSGALAGWWADDAAGRGIRLVGFDRAGYGGSDRHPGRRVADVAGDATAIADALGVDRFRTWGVSGGGPHALACAARRPDRIIAAATLASVTPFRAEGLDWLAGMGQDNIDEFGAAVQGEGALRPFLDEAGAGMAAAGPDGLADQIRSIIPDVDAAVMVGEVADFLYAWLVGGQRAGIDGWLDDDLAFVSEWGFDPAEIRVPVLVVHGRQDLMVPFAHGHWLGAHIPGVATRFAEADGHITLITDIADTHRWLLEQR